MAEDKKPETNGPNIKIEPQENHRQERGNRYSGHGHGHGGRFPPRRDGRQPEDYNPGDGNEGPDNGPRRRPGQGGRGGRNGPSGPGGGPGGRNAPALPNQRSDDRTNEKLLTMGGNTYDLPHREVQEQKFSSRCRLYVGNLVDITEDEINEMFKPFGEVSELFVNAEKMFAFIRLDYRANAERAKRELDGIVRKGRQLKVRFAPLGATIKVKNLSPCTTNELLEYAFSIFGDIERAQILVDDRGNSLKEGIVEFARKPAALMALRRCSEGCYFLTSSLRPVVAEPYDIVDDVDGFPEKAITRKTPDFLKERETGPRFANPGSFDFDYGTRWKQLYELYKQKEESLKREMKLEEEKLEAQMEYARFEHETEMLREQLRQREMDRERQKMEWEMKERQAEDQRRMDDDMMRRRADDMTMRMHHQEEGMRRRQQDNSLFLQAAEQAIRGGAGAGGGYGDSPNIPLGEAAVLREFEALTGSGSLIPEAKEHNGGGPRGDFRNPASRGGWSRGGHDRSQGSPGGEFRPKKRRY